MTIDQTRREFVRVTSGIASVSVLGSASGQAIDSDWADPVADGPVTIGLVPESGTGDVTSVGPTEESVMTVNDDGLSIDIDPVRVDTVDYYGIYDSLVVARDDVVLFEMDLPRSFDVEYLDGINFRNLGVELQDST